MTHLEKGDGWYQLLPATEDEASGNFSILNSRQADAQVFTAFGCVHLSIIPEDGHNTDWDPAQKQSRISF